MFHIPSCPLILALIVNKNCSSQSLILRFMVLLKKEKKKNPLTFFLQQREKKASEKTPKRWTFPHH